MVNLAKSDSVLDSKLSAVSGYLNQLCSFLISFAHDKVGRTVSMDSVLEDSDVNVEDVSFHQFPIIRDAINSTTGQQSQPSIEINQRRLEKPYSFTEMPQDAGKPL